MIERYYGTLGPACTDEEILHKMFLQGMTGARLNLSHTNLSQCEELLTTYFQAARGVIKSPELIIDLQGPELRIGVLERELTLKDGEGILLATQTDVMQQEFIPVPKEVLWSVKRQQLLMLDDGKILIEVEEILNHENEAIKDENCPIGGRLKCRIIRGGLLTSRKSIAVPGCEIHLPTLTAMDIKNIAVAKEYAVTGVMLPFVRGVEDLTTLRKALKEAGAEHIRIFAKIENLEGVEKLKELIPACDEIVIARGDLGNSVPLWDLPALQDRIATTCRQHKRPFMVVTQMLASMEHNPIPTRAEVTDIYHAVSSGASSIMLTAETAVGEYPVEAMEYLIKTGKAAKKHYEV